MMTICSTSRQVVLQRMAEAAVLAPTAENVQHWRLAMGEDRLSIGLDPHRCFASDVDQMLVLTGIGTAIENVVIAARQEGIEPKVEYSQASPLEIGDSFTPLAEVIPGENGEADPLYHALQRRCTSRRMRKERIPSDSLDRLADTIRPFSGVRVDWVAPNDVRAIARLAGTANRIRFEYEPFHREFYHNLRFDREQVERTRDGLDVATLQLPWGVGSLLRALRAWPRMRAANWLGFSRAVARQAAAEVCSSGAVGVLSVDDARPSSFINGGRALERIWLTATINELGFHPAAALPVFLGYAARTRGDRLLAKHQRLVQVMSQEFARLFPRLKNRVVQMVFRVGLAERPKVRSLRRPVEDFMSASHR